jgi:putative membrane protein insertion efficiency factor
MRPALIRERADEIAQAADPGWSVRVALGTLRAYKLVVSPLFAGACRFTPSCSDYMAAAIREHGLAKGGWLGFRRLIRCHPLGGHGFDPVPPRV